jgi:hypothetical protein
MGPNGRPRQLQLQLQRGGACRVASAPTARAHDLTTFQTEKPLRVPRPSSCLSSASILMAFPSSCMDSYPGGRGLQLGQPPSSPFPLPFQSVHGDSVDAVGYVQVVGELEGRGSLLPGPAIPRGSVFWGVWNTRLDDLLDSTRQDTAGAAWHLLCLIRTGCALRSPLNRGRGLHPACSLLSVQAPSSLS